MCVELSTYEECRFFLESSTAKMWTVPWSLAAQSSDESELKFKLNLAETTDNADLFILNSFAQHFFTNRLWLVEHLVLVHLSDYLMMCQIS